MIAPKQVNVFNARLDLQPPPDCLSTPEELRAWLARSVVSMKVDGVLFGYTVGTLSAATEEDRDKPRFVYDAQDRYLGLALWSKELQGWTIGGQVGQLMTLARFGPSVAADLAARPMAGWKLADGTAVGVPDLKANTNFFTGTSPDWGVYTVAYTG
jgi:hypothetical protein